MSYRNFYDEVVDAPDGPTCEETLGMIGDEYIRCGDRARTLVRYKGRSEGPYWMCRLHAAHAIDNRGGEPVT